MMSTHTAYVYFGLCGEFNPVDFAAHIPLQADECVAKHSNDSLRQIPKTSLLRYAQLETFANLIDIYDLAEKAVDILEPHRDAFVSAIGLHGATPTFQVVLFFPTSEEISTPSLGFSKRVIEFVASVGASIDIDSYRSR